MGVIDFCNTSSLCMIKSNLDKPSCGFEGNQRRVVAMASTLPVKPLSEVDQEKITGDSFIRPHLRKLSPYQSILPFEVKFMELPSCLIMFLVFFKYPFSSLMNP